MAKQHSKKRGPAINAIAFENTGEDPDVFIELPEGIECETFADDQVDVIGAVYDDGERFRAVLVVVAFGATAEEAVGVLDSRLPELPGEAL